MTSASYTSPFRGIPSLIPSNILTCSGDYEYIRCVYIHSSVHVIFQETAVWSDDSIYCQHRRIVSKRLSQKRARIIRNNKIPRKHACPLTKAYSNYIFGHQLYITWKLKKVQFVGFFSESVTRTRRWRFIEMQVKKQWTMSKHFRISVTMITVQQQPQNCRQPSISR